MSRPRKATFPLTLTIPAPGPFLNACSIPDCSSPVLCRGWCGRHYQRWARYGDPEATKMFATDAERFWAKVEKTSPDGCWLWTAGRRNDYGLFNVPPTTIGAHRFAYQLTYGAIPSGLMVDHRCRVKLCVNPAHLQLADHSTNGQNLPTETVRGAKSGIRGVQWNKTEQKWAARVVLHGRTYSAGSHQTVETAAAAVVALRNQLHTNNLADRDAR